jgi:hypothetical protein
MWRGDLKKIFLSLSGTERGMGGEVKRVYG